MSWAPEAKTDPISWQMLWRAVAKQILLYFNSWQTGQMKPYPFTEVVKQKLNQNKPKTYQTTFSLNFPLFSGFPYHIRSSGLWMHTFLIFKIRRRPWVHPDFRTRLQTIFQLAAKPPPGLDYCSSKVETPPSPTFELASTCPDKV